MFVRNVTCDNTWQYRQFFYIKQWLQFIYSIKIIGFVTESWSHITHNCDYNAFVLAKLQKNTLSFIMWNVMTSHEVLELQCNWVNHTTSIFRYSKSIDLKKYEEISSRLFGCGEYRHRAFHFITLYRIKEIY